MKTTKTLFITLICSFIFSLTTPSSIAFANHTLITSNVYAASTDATPPEISPASHTIVWKYKTLNGVLYKCRYNQTTRKWIGKWISLFSCWAKPLELLSCNLVKKKDPVQTDSPCIFF